MSRRVAADRPSSRFARLSTLDLMFLRVESEAWPCHFGGLAVLDGGVLVDPPGRLRLGEIVDRLSRRLATVPRLRRRVLFPGPLRGRPLWVDDAGFDLQQHVLEAKVEPPGGDGELLDKAAELCGSVLDRSRPLWELWFLTGLTEGRVGALLKLHHAVADGLAAVALMASLFDDGQGDSEQGSATWEPEPFPTGTSLLADGLSTKIRGIARVAAGLAHPINHARQFRIKAGIARRILSPARAPRTSLNRPVRAGRAVRFLCLDLTAVKDAAHGRGCKVNDVVLDVWTGGLRQLLMSRGEQVAQLEPVTTVPASLRRPRTQAPAATSCGRCRSCYRCGSPTSDAGSASSPPAPGRPKPGNRPQRR
jgi:WS/DGAT/MGAT family acyltransferase